MEKISEQIDRLADLNPCIRFVIDNYDALCLAHPGKTVLVVGKCVFKAFPSMVEAMMYTDAIDMRSVPYALKECDGGDACSNLVYSMACKTPD